MNQGLLLKIYKYIIGLTGILNLALVPIHIEALNKTDVPVSGFFMFMFVLVGLVCLFNVTRIEKLDLKTMLANCGSILLAVGLGITLVFLYFKGVDLGIEKNIDVAPIYSGIGFSIAILVAYFGGLVSFILASVSKKV